jgi:flavin-binding protein dodecin
MARATRTAQIIGSSTRSLDAAIHDGLARARRWGAAWARVTKISARAVDDGRRRYRVRLLVGAHRP